MINITVKGYSCGHEIEYNEDMNQWVYSDTKDNITNVRKCIKCGCKPTEEGYDSCIGYLKGVKSACCGHGVENPYVVFNDGRHLNFKNIEEMKEYFNFRKNKCEIKELRELNDEIINKNKISESELEEIVNEVCNRTKKKE